MPDLRRLIHFIESAPAGTMVPVESLREFLPEGADEAPDTAAPPRLLTPAEAADWLHAQLGGRKRTAAAIRKAMRTGFRGVVLKSFPYGRERRTTEADLRVYLAQIGTVAHPAASEPPPARIAPATTFHVKSSVDPGDEIAAAQERFRVRENAPCKARERERRAGSR